ncbi:hypothetical protein [Natronorarus salvus]
MFTDALAFEREQLAPIVVLTTGLLIALFAVGVLLRALSLVGL